MKATDHNNFRGIEPKIKRVREAFQQGAPLVAMDNRKVVRVLLNARERGTDGIEKLLTYAG